MKFQVVETTATKPAGSRPYSTALRVGEWLIIAGQVSTDANGDIVGRGDPETQWRQCLGKLKALVEEVGGSMADIVDTKIFVTDMRYHLAHSEIRREFFQEPYPTATVVGVTALAHEDWLIEIAATAYLGR